jgi:hypothetical protein
VLGGLSRDLDPVPAVGEQGVAPGVDLRDRRAAVADARYGAVLVFQRGLLSLAGAKR